MWTMKKLKVFVDFYTLSFWNDKLLKCFCFEETTDLMAQATDVHVSCATKAACLFWYVVQSWKEKNATSIMPWRKLMFDMYFSY